MSCDIRQLRNHGVSDILDFHLYTRNMVHHTCPPKPLKLFKSAKFINLERYAEAEEQESSKKVLPIVTFGRACDN